MEKAPNQIETVCYGNVARSKLAQRSINQELNERGVFDYEVVSSGISVDSLKQSGDGLKPYDSESMDWCIRRGIERHLFTSGEIDEIQQLYQTIDGKRVRTVPYNEPYQWFGASALQIFCEEELINRGFVLDQAGLDPDFSNGDGKEVFTQTAYNPNALLVLGIEPSHLEYIDSIYNGRGNNRRKVKTDTLVGYATGKRGASLAEELGLDKSFGHFGRDIDTFEYMFHVGIIPFAEMAVDRFLRRERQRRFFQSIPILGKLAK